jgi:predicted Rossmann-fold nucleotide-binding protein
MSRMHQHDHSPDEIESREELELHLAGNTLRGLTVQGLHLGDDPPDWAKVDVAGTLFIACHFDSQDTEVELIRGGAHVIPPLPNVPYPTHPPHLYMPHELSAGFAEHGFAGMFDTVVYRHFIERGGALPGVREALSQRMHDHGIDDALADAVDGWAGSSRSVAEGGDGQVNGPVVGIMGGHAEPRGSAGYRAAAEIGQGLATAGCLVVTGGGPGVMEAANLGAFMATASRDDLATAIDDLAAEPDFHNHDPFTKVALEVRARYSRNDRDGDRQDFTGWAKHGGLSVPTWLYGHEPANLFAARIAKYFSNAIREDTILRLTRGGIVFAKGRAGTVQEIFQAATKTFYATDGTSGPFVFLGTDFWTNELPVESLLKPLFAACPHGDLTHLIEITDDPAEAVQMILTYAAPAEAKEGQHTTP